MKNFNEIVLTKHEYKRLKYVRKTGELYLKGNSVNYALYRYNLITKGEKENLYHISDNGKRYLIWYRRYCWKSYYPVAISVISLAVSIIYPIIDYLFRN